MTQTAVLFPGQGSLTSDAGDLARGACPELVEQAIAIVGSDPFERAHESTEYAQPAIFLASIAGWRERDVPDVVAMAGHSLGELSVLAAAGAVAVEDALRLVALRGRLMQAAAAKGDEGGMVALLGGDPADAERLAHHHGLAIANDNAPGQLVLSGPLAAIEEAAAIASAEADARARVLDVGGAFHSRLMEPAADDLRAALDDTPVAPQRFPVYSNGTAAPFGDVRAELAENLLRPVRWRETLLALRAAGVERFVELGPGAVLAGLVKRTLRAAA